MRKLLMVVFALSLSGCWTMYSKDYMKTCQDTCAPNKVDRVSEYVCECQGDNETSDSHSEHIEERGGYRRY